MTWIYSNNRLYRYKYNLLRLVAHIIIDIIIDHHCCCSLHAVESVMCSGRKVLIVHVIHQEQGSEKKKFVSGLGIRGEMHGEVLWSLESISQECSPVVSNTSILRKEGIILFEICFVYLFTCSVKGAWSLKMIMSSNLKQR